MTVTVRYIGTTNPFFETALTGKPTKWTPGLSGDVPDDDAATLLQTGLFEQVTSTGAVFFTSISGADYLVLPDGTPYQLTPAVGTYAEASVLGVKQAVVTLDSGNDANPHNDWALTYECTLAGQPGVPNGPLAVERFVRANPNEIVITGLLGSVDAGIVYFPEFTALSMVHVAQLGGTTYPDSADATARLNEKVRVDFPEGTIALEIQARGPTGANGRYRQIIFTPYLARA